MNTTPPLPAAAEQPAVATSRSETTAFLDRDCLGSIKIKTILVPLDFSPASTEALDYAVSLTKQFRAAIHLVHVQQRQ